MSEFKWTIEYTLNLTYPVFFELGLMLNRIRADSAIDGIYAGYSAAKYGQSCADSLFRRRGSFMLKPDIPAYTEEDLKAAEKRLKSLSKKQ